jgi:zinc protease
MTASALLYGTTNRDFDELHETLEGLGADLDFHANVSSCGFGGKSLAEDLPTLLDVLQDALRNPSFPPDHVERLRGQYVTGMQMRAFDTRYRAGRAFYELAYAPDHPYHRSSDGTLETLPGLTREMMVDFHRKYYGPRDSVVVIVGAVKAEEAIDAVEKALGDWQNPSQPGRQDVPPAAAAVAVKRVDVAIPGKTQSDIVLGVPGPTRMDPEFHAARLVNSVLGLFGMMGRLGKTVREAQGLAYYSYSMVEGNNGPAPWRAIAGVNPANVQRAVDSIVYEINRICTEKVSEDELADNKANFTGRLPLQLENNEGVASAILRMELQQLGLDYMRTYADVISALTVDDLLAAAQKYFGAGNYVLGVAGPEAAAAE